MARIDLISQLEENLKELGLMISEFCDVEGSCFNYALRKGSKLIFLRVVDMLSEVAKEESLELSLITERLSAIPLIVSRLALRRSMEDGVIYKRYDISAVTLRTFLNALEGKDLPLVEASPGGFFVSIDHLALRKRMSELGISRGELASIVGISRKALYDYEYGLTKCTLGVALRLETALGIPLVQNLNVFDRRHHHVHSREIPTFRGILQKVLSKLMGIGMRVTLTRRAPFDFIADDRRGNKFLVGIVRRREPAEERRIDLLYSVARVAMVSPLIVAKREVEDERVIALEELRNVQEPAELLKLC